MKTALYYFSGTGNSLVAARDLSRELGGADLISIPQAIGSKGESAYDRIGIIFPVYMFGLPLIVADFLRAVQLPKGAYLFTVATFGGIPGRPHNLAGDILASRGLLLKAGFNILMPGNYTPLYGAIAEDKQRAMFDGESAHIREIANMISEKREGYIERCHPIFGFLLYALLYRGGSAQIRGADKDFWVTEACTKCGLCAKVCPVLNIDPSKGQPVWRHHCEHCMACLQWCPVQAIQYKKNTVGRVRYHHPAVKAADIVNAAKKAG